MNQYRNSELPVACCQLPVDFETQRFTSGKRISIELSFFNISTTHRVEKQRFVAFGNQSYL